MKIGADQVGRRTGRHRPQRRANRLRKSSQGPAAERLEGRALLSAGDPDPFFGVAGKVLATNPPIFHRTGQDVAVQSDGKVVVVGTRAPALSTTTWPPPHGPGDVMVARRNADLTPDATFGAGGEVRIDLGGDDAASSVALDPAGRILVGAASRTPTGNVATWNVMRFLPAGTPDPTFGTGGRVSFPGASTFGGRLDLAVAPTGRIFAAGATPEGNFSVIALTASGRLDNTFGGDGVVAVTFGFARNLEEATAVAATPDGRVVAAGIDIDFAGPSSTNPALVARLNADGSLDPTFGAGGKVIDRRPSPGPTELDAALDSRGRVVLAGTSNGASGFVMRQTPAGAPDASFGNTNGIVTFGPAYGNPSFHAVAVAPNDDVIAAGTRFTGTGYDFAAVRVTAGGQVMAVATDDYYGDTYSFEDHGAGVALTPQGRTVVVGTVSVNGFTTYGVSRFNLGPADNPAADFEAHATGPFEGAQRRVYDAVVQPDRKVVVAGSSVTGPDFNFFLARYNPDGTPDRTFGDNGTVLTDFGANRNDEARALLLRPDGRIVAAGSSRLMAKDRLHSITDVAVARYNPDGSPDASFGGGDGEVLTGVGRDASATDIDAYPGDRIVVSNWAGVVRYTASGGLDPTFAGDGSLELNYPGAVLTQGDKVLVAESGGVERYNADGSRDATFNTVPLPGSYGTPDDLALAADGGVIASGTHYVYHDNEPETRDVAAWKLKADGSLDTTFGTAGMATLPVTGFYQDGGVKLVVQPDGRIVAATAGELDSYVRNRYRYETVGLVARWNPNGKPDTTFGIDGAAVVYGGLSLTGVGVDPTGDVVAAGNVADGNPVGGFGIVRLKGSGEGPGLVLDRAARVLTVKGSAGDDRIDVRVFGGRLFVLVNGHPYNAARTSFDRVTVYGGDGNDTMTISTPVQSLQLLGGAGDDSLRGSRGPDAIGGGAGNDTIDGGLGADTLTGGSGTDTLDYRSRTNPVTAAEYYDDEYERSYQRAGEFGEGDVPTDYFEKIYGGSGNDDLHAVAKGGAVFGGAGNDTLSGGSNADALFGEDGDDTLYNSRGADFMRGGAGNDTVNYFVDQDFTDVNVSLDEAANDGRSGEGDNVGSDVENVIGGNGNDRLTGSFAANRLDGGRGNDTILGLAGNDTLLGGQGDDTLTDTQGTNTFQGGTGTDTVNGVTEPSQADVLEAEDAKLSGPTNKGSYIDFTVRPGEYVEWTYFSAAAGRRTLSFRYANGASHDRPLELRVNGVVIAPSLSFPPTGSWDAWGTVEVTTDLVAGFNTIRLTTTGSSGGNFDALVIAP